nr:hypothetical protein [Tanacetum cinerariifolium]
MARIFITGSADGLGQLAARQLVQQGHQVVLHARSPERAQEARAAVPQAEAAVAGDLSTLAGMHQVAEQAYCDSKLHDLLLSNAVARHWPDVLSNAVDPGWVPTKMGGAGAPDNLAEGARTQAWLAAGDDPAAHLTGQYLHHQRPSAAHPQAADPAVQERLLAECARLTGVAFPTRYPGIGTGHAENGALAACYHEQSSVIEQ